MKCTSILFIHLTLMQRISYRAWRALVVF